MEKHIVTFFFLLLIAFITFSIIRQKKVLRTEISFLAFAMAFLVQLYFEDDYKIWSFFFGAGIGFFVIEILHNRILPTIDDKIRKKLLWKVPLLGALGAGAASRFGYDWLVWALLLAVTTILIPQFRNMGQKRLIILLLSEALLLIASLVSDMQVILSFLILSTIYMLLALSRKVREK